MSQYTLANAVADLDALRGTLGADRIVLWGESWGGSLAAAYVRAHPDHVAAIVLDSPGDFPGEPLPLDYGRTDTRGAFQPKLREAAMFLLISNAPHLAEDWQSQADLRASNRARSETEPYIYGYQCKGATARLRRPASTASHNLAPQLLLQNDLETQPRVVGPLSTAPALLIRGSCDYLSSANAARYMRALPAGRRVDVPGRGHAFFGHEAELAAVIRRFATSTLATLP